MNPPILHWLDGIGDLQQLARGFLGVKGRSVAYFTLVLGDVGNMN
jgi:hypothetical protein